MAEFQFIINGEMVTFDKYEDVPKDFDHVIKFIPDVPEPEGEDGGHTEEQHEEFALWNGRLQELIKREGK